MITVTCVKIFSFAKLCCDAIRLLLFFKATHEACFPLLESYTSMKLEGLLGLVFWTEDFVTWFFCASIEL